MERNLVRKQAGWLAAPDKREPLRAVDLLRRLRGPAPRAAEPAQAAACARTAAVGVAVRVWALLLLAVLLLAALVELVILWGRGGARR